MTQEELKTLTVLAIKLMREAAERGKSMVEMDIDPRQVMGVSTPHPANAGKIFIAVAGGPSIKRLQTAVALANAPQ